MMGKVLEFSALVADEQFVLINVFFSKFSTGFMLKKGWKFKLGLATLPS